MCARKCARVYVCILLLIFAIWCIFQSVSEDWRERGNDLYRQVADGLSPSVQVLRLQDAINHYDRAVSTASNNDER